MKKYITMLSFMLIAGLFSCKKYLDINADAENVIPKTFKDCQLLMDDYTILNASFYAEGEAAADNYYITDANFNGITNVDERDNYIWDAQGRHSPAWSKPYEATYKANLVLEVLKGLRATDPQYNSLKGTALFFRAFAFYNLAQLFAQPYRSASAQNDLGIVLKLTPNVEPTVKRATLKETYDKIVQDFTDAASLLPVTTSIQSRPNKAATYAALARTYLTIEDYANAERAATEALKLHDDLMDFKSITTIPRFNKEVIFQALANLPRTLSPQVAKIDKTLYDSYVANDKRKSVFFRENTGANAGTYLFKGSYDGSILSQAFIGFATDELYLIRAECHARTGKIQASMDDLNTLLIKRWDPAATDPAAPFVPVTAGNATEALDKILIERRKELVYRNHRWTDLRRLNKDPRYAIKLERNKNTIAYTPLESDDLRYTMLIPIAEEVSLSGIPQNPR